MDRSPALLLSVDLPRFVALDIDDLVALASFADPPVRLGDWAEVTHRDRKILLEARSIDPLVEWVERADPSTTSRP